MLNKNDIRLLAAILILAVICFGGYRLFFYKTGSYVTITINSEIYQTLPLDQEITLEIPGENGGSNTLEIKNGTAHIIDADCPDKLCVHQKSIQYQGESLVCLPHKVIVTVTSDVEKDLDNVAY